MQVCMLAAGEGARIPLAKCGGEASTGVPPSSGLGGAEVKVRVLLAVSTGAAYITSVEAVKEQSSWDVQKPPRWTG